MASSIEILDFESQEKLDQACLDFLYTPLMTIGEWIKTCRTAAKMNQTQLGDALGVTKGNVSAWENDRHEPSYTQMLKIADMGQMPLPGLTPAAPAWPFPEVARERVDALSDEQRREIQAAVLTMLSLIEARNPRKSEAA